MSTPARPSLELARRARGIATSPTVAMSQRASALRAQGRRVLDFSVGEPDQPTPPQIRRAAERALEAGRTRYTPPAGLEELRAAVAARYREDFGSSFAPEEVAIACGGKHALYAVCQVLLERGGEVILPAPFWPTFAEAVRLAGARPVRVDTVESEGFRLTPRRIAGAVTPRTRAVIVNSPSNPTGAVVAGEDLLAIGRLARRRRLALLYDDTYARLSFERREPGVLRALRDATGDRLVLLGTASKTYCMTGWRIGWVLAPRGLVDAFANLASHSTQNPTTFAQVGAVEALTGSQRAVRELVAEYRRRRDVFHRAVAALPRVSCVRPAGAFYLFPNLKAHLGPAAPTTLALAGRLLEEQGVAAVPGEAFGAPGYLRLSFARPLEELREGAARLAAFLDGR